MTRDRLLTGVLFAGLIASVTVFLVERLKDIASPFEIVYGEGLLWYQTYIVLNGIPLYKSVTSTEYYIIPHTPLFVIICSWFSSIFGDTLTVGRALSLVCGFGICVVVYLITKRLTGNSIVSLLAGLLVVTTYVFRFLVPIYRLDSMGLMLSLLGIYLFMEFEERGKLVYWTIPVFVLAFFTKQVFVVAPVAVCIYLFVKNRWRVLPSLKFGGLYLVLLSIGLLIGGLLTNWELIIHNFLYMTRDVGVEQNWTHYLLNLDFLLSWHAPLLLGVLGYFGYKIYKRKPLILVDIYFLGGLVVALALIGKLGGGFHYGFEMVAVGCILVGLLMDKAFRVFRERELNIKQIGVGAVVFVIVGFQIIGIPFGWNFFTYEYLDTNEEGMNQLVSKLQEVEGPVFAYIFATPMDLAGRIEEWIPWEYPLFTAGIHKEEGRLGWDQSDMVEKLETGYYQLAVFEHDVEFVWRNDPSVYWVGLSRQKISREVATALLENFKFVLRTEAVGTNRFPMRYYIYQYDGIGMLDYEKGIQIYK